MPCSGHERDRRLIFEKVRLDLKRRRTRGGEAVYDRYVAGRGGRIAGGCLLIAVGSIAAYAGLLWAALESAYGGNRSSAQLIFIGILVAGLGGVVWGIVLIFRRPKG